MVRIIRTLNYNNCKEEFTVMNKAHKPLENWANDNNIQHILDRKLCDFWINSSHNSFLEMNQVLGESRISNLSKSLESGARCVELDIHLGTTEPLVVHTGSLPGILSDYLAIIRDEGFKNTNDPLIVYLEIFDSGNEYHMKNIGSLIQSYLGNRLYEMKMSTWNGDNSKYCFNTPVRKLLGKILIVINFYNMSTPDGKGLIYRDKYLSPICHATANEPTEGWYPELGSLVNNVGANDPIKIKQKNQLIRVYPNNTLKSSNYDPDPFWVANYNIVSLNFGNEDKNMKKNNKKFKYCSFIPFDIIISPDGKVNKPVQDVFTWDSARTAPLYNNITAESYIIMPNKCYYNNSIWWSDNNQDYLKMQSDGNLVLYKKDLSNRKGKQDKVLWSSKTSNNQNAILHMQNDGNLVIYNGAGSKALWSSNTNGNSGAYATLTDDDFDIFNLKGGHIKRLF